MLHDKIALEQTGTCPQGVMLGKVRQVNPETRIIQLSSTKSDNFSAWTDQLARHVRLKMIMNKQSISHEADLLMGLNQVRRKRYGNFLLLHRSVGQVTKRLVTLFSCLEIAD